MIYHETAIIARNENIFVTKSGADGGSWNEGHTGSNGEMACQREIWDSECQLSRFYRCLLIRPPRWLVHANKICFYAKF